MFVRKLYIVIITNLLKNHTFYIKALNITKQYTLLITTVAPLLEMAVVSSVFVVVVEAETSVVNESSSSLSPK